MSSLSRPLRKPGLPKLCFKPPALHHTGCCSQITEFLKLAHLRLQPQLSKCTTQGSALSLSSLSSTWAQPCQRLVAGMLPSRVCLLSAGVHCVMVELAMLGMLLWKHAMPAWRI